MYPLNVVQSNGFGDVGGVEEGGMDDPCELSHKLLSKMIATLKGQRSMVFSIPILYSSFLYYVLHPHSYTILLHPHSYTMF